MVLQVRHFVIGGLLVLLAACAGPDELESLDKTLRAYEHTLRWSRLEQANQFFKEQKEFSASDLERMKNIQVTGYRVVTTNASINHARQVVEIRYFNNAYAIERTLTDIQEWEYDQENERWYLSSSFPKFKY